MDDLTPDDMAYGMTCAFMLALAQAPDMTLTFNKDLITHFPYTDYHLNAWTDDEGNQVYSLSCESKVC